MNTKDSTYWIVPRTAVLSLLLPALLLLTLPVVAQGQFGYTTNNGSITITGYSGPGGDVIFPDTIEGLPVTAIGGYVFMWTTEPVTSITIPDSVTSIGDYAFQYSRLTNAVIGNGVTNIGKLAFSYLPLASITIPDSVTTIGDSAFAGCASLTSIFIPDNVTAIGKGAFEACSSLLSITASSLNPAYSSLDGVLFNKDANTLTQCPGGKAGSYTVPTSVTTIGVSAFSGCTSLTSVTLPDSVTSIEWNGFRGCASLTNIALGYGLRTIKQSGFEACYGLTSVMIPNSVTNIEGWAFNGSSGLTAVYFLGNAPAVGPFLFLNTDKATVYYLPGSTGWEPSLDGRPTALWLPQIHPRDGSFGIWTNQFGFNISWVSGMSVVVEACTTLTSPVWTPVATNILDEATQYFSDPEWTNYPARLYRLRWHSAGGSGRGGRPPINPPHVDP